MDNQKNECLLSIVVPVYNTEKFLASCLDSLLSQDLSAEKYEIICVNDGSKDSSGDILDKYSAQYSNVRVITQENKGHAAARNTGMLAAKGKYIWFVDSDDYVDEQCFGFIVQLMDENSVDMLSIRYAPFFKEEEVPHTPGNYIHPTKKTTTDIACSGIRIFNLNMLISNNIFWNAELSPCDDVEFIFFAKMNSKNVVFNNSVAYYHRQWAGSVTSQKSDEHRKKYINSFYLLAKTYKQELHNPKYNKEQLSEIEDRKNLSTQAILMQLAMYESKQTINEHLQKLKADGLYPYKKIKYNLKPKISLKRTIMDWVQYFFPIERYYKLFCHFVKK